MRVLRLLSHDYFAVLCVCVCVCVCVFTLSCLNNGNKKKERRAKYEKSDLSRDAMQLLLAQAC